ncbi:type III secretion system inner membrane ring lipoprotein SctJ [Chlamydia suis]|uniref:type III secretion system inner membrane ring lipoprotein SctJ n=1 Tax=Chlamydia suis TaxID=83559 RepID=UPI0009B0A1FE|nr:type III secretion inner membrane ring lipoprotein SctJ [Chlamydia suis]
MFRYTLFRSLFFIFALLCCSACDSRSIITHGLSGREANEIVVLLVSKGVSAQKIPQAASSTGGGASEQLWDISVPAAQITEALAILNQAGLPRMKGTSLLDLFAKQGLVPSEMQEKIRYQEGLSEQMATTIRKMDGIVDASVQISFSPEEDQLPLTASVYIKHRGVLDNPNSIMVSKIKRLVASAVPGLCPENVSVVSDRASYSDITINGPWGLSDEIDYVSVWGIILAKNSLTKFRLVFYFLILLLFVLSCGLLWVIWKTHTLIAALGGTKGFFNPAPYSQLAFTQNKPAAKENPAPSEGVGAQSAAEEAPKDNTEKQEESNEDA